MTHTKREVTIFKDIFDKETPFYRDVNVVLKRIRDGHNKEIVLQIRKTKSKEERNTLKKKLPAICFSGKFNKRYDQHLLRHSGLICLDFDDYANQKDMLADKKRLSEDKIVFAVFVSPSGMGLKVLVKIPADAERHRNFFMALQSHFDSPHFDTTSKNVSRVCYESYDPLIYVNENSQLWDIEEEEEYISVDANVVEPVIPISDESRIIEILTRWWTKKYPMVQGKRNENIFILAMAFNEFGISKSTAEYVMLQYTDVDFPEHEIRKTINSAYRHTEKHATKFYEDRDAYESVRTKLNRGVPKKEVRDWLEEETGVNRAQSEQIVERAEEERSQWTFWKVSDRGAISILPHELKRFLEEKGGFYKFSPESSTNYIFVRVVSNLVDHTTEQEIKDYVLDYLLHEREEIDVYNYFADKTRFFREEYLTLLGSIDLFFIKDTKEIAYLYYKNCAVKVTKRGAEIIDYTEIEGFVWRQQVIDRNFRKCKVGSCVYPLFISHICAKDEERVKSMESVIGFLLHAFKNNSFCPAIILNDEQISENPEGGTGKGIFFNGIGHMKKMVIIDGKQFDFSRTFAYQLVSADTQILLFDDVRKNFAFQNLFSLITEGLTLEKKNRDAIHIPFSRSPKIGITTNYAIPGRGNSYERRKFELELHQYYRKDFTPEDEFGKMLFIDWSESEWCQFDNYMLACLRGYLNTGLIESKHVNLEMRQLIQETSHEFVEWCGLLPNTEENDLIEPLTKVYKDDLFTDFTNVYQDFARGGKRAISRQWFYKWLNAFCLFRYGATPQDGRDSKGRWMIILRKETKGSLKFDT